MRIVSRISLVGLSPFGPRAGPSMPESMQISACFPKSLFEILAISA